MAPPYAFKGCSGCGRYHRASAPAGKTCKELDAFDGAELDKRYGFGGWFDKAGPMFEGLTRAPPRRARAKEAQP